MDLASHDGARTDCRMPVVEQVGIGEVRVLRVRQVSELERADHSAGRLAGVEAGAVRVPVRGRTSGAVRVSPRAGTRIGSHDETVVELDIVVDDDAATEATGLREVVEE